MYIQIVKLGVPFIECCSIYPYFTVTYVPILFVATTYFNTQLVRFGMQVFIINSIQNHYYN